MGEVRILTQELSAGRVWRRNTSYNQAGPCEKPGKGNPSLCLGKVHWLGLFGKQSEGDSKLKKQRSYKNQLFYSNVEKLKNIKHIHTNSKLHMNS